MINNNESSCFLIKDYFKIFLLIILLILFLHLHLILINILFNYYSRNDIGVQSCEHISYALKELKQLNHLYLDLR